MWFFAKLYQRYDGSRPLTKVPYPPNLAHSVGHSQRRLFPAAFHAVVTTWLISGVVHGRG